MDTKVINVYNEKNRKLVGSGLIIVDAATEPLKVLKVLVEGLPDGRSGLWLTNFKGIPVARTLSPFDLVYLDPSYSVVHCVEISIEGEYEPFRGDPASALVLPAKSIASARVEPGDRLQFRTADAASQPASGPRPSRAPQQPPLRPPANQPSNAQFFNSAFPIPPSDAGGSSFPGTLPQGPLPQSGMPAAMASDNAPSAQAVSGRLTKSARSLLDASPAFRPSTGDDPQPGSRDIGIGSVATMQTSSAPVEMAFSVKAPTHLMGSTLELGMGAVAEHLPEAQSSTTMQSGRLLRSVNLAPAILPMEEEEEIAPPVTESHPAAATAAPAIEAEVQTPAAAAAAAPGAVPEREKPREPSHGIVIPFTSAPSHHAHPPVHDGPAPITARPIAPAASTAHALAIVPAPRAEPVVAPQEFFTPAPPIVASAPAMAPQMPATDGAVAIPSPYPRTQIKPAETQNALALPQKKGPSWDVRLLYRFFPEFDPARPPEIRIPRLGEKKEPVVDDEEEISMKLRMLCWLYPDLHLDKVKQKRSEERRAVRLPMPGLVAYFFTGGAPRPHPIKDISITGFYMCTNERWLPGTIIRVTLQMVDARSEGSRDAITVHSRVVRWGPDGGGFEFVLPGFLEQ